MVKLEVCSFSGYKIPVSHGRWYIRVDGASCNLVSSAQSMSLSPVINLIAH